MIKFKSKLFVIRVKVVFILLLRVFKVLPMVPMVYQYCSRFYQWYHTNGTICNTTGTNGNANGTFGSPHGTIGNIGKPIIPLAANGTIRKNTMVSLGELRTEPLFPHKSEYLKSTIQTKVFTIGLKASVTCTSCTPVRPSRSVCSWRLASSRFAARTSKDLLFGCPVASS